jgi:hypothetical protein
MDAATAMTMDADGATSTDADAAVDTHDDSAVTPSADAAALAMDAQATAPEAVVMFGGGGGSDTWEWDGTNWTDRSPALAPSARSWASMASIGNKVVLFGGSNGLGVLGDTWEWDGTSWTQLLIPGPPAREGALMAAYQGQVVLVGGLTSASSFPVRNWDVYDTWVFDGASWTVQEGPLLGSAGWGMGEAAAPSSGCSSTCPSTVLVLFGTGSLENGTMIWDGAVWSLIDVAESHTNIYPPPYGSLLTSLGGSVLLVQSEAPTWQWTAGEWTQVPPAVGPSAAGGAMAGMAGSAVMYDNSTASETWVWSAGAWVNAAPATDPGFRYGHAMATRFAH